MGVWNWTFLAGSVAAAVHIADRRKSVQKRIRFSCNECFSFLSSFITLLQHQWRNACWVVCLRESLCAVSYE